MDDVVVRDVSVVDGSGGQRFNADVAVRDGKFSHVGSKAGRGKIEVNGNGLLLAPGWVDIHTHYDGQAMWDSFLTPSSWHGVTTAVFGNCGVGFAPVIAGSEKYLINLMEGVEDIPEAVLSEGLDFNWQTFPEYMNVLEQKKRILDVGTQIPHAALRFYVMGERGADHESRPNSEEIEKMGTLVEEALIKGALGFSTSRTIKHKSGDGSYTPSLTAKESELMGIARAMRRAGRGVLEVNSDFADNDFEVLRRVAYEADCPLTVLLLQVHNAPDLWRDTLARIKRARGNGQKVNGQVGTRPIGMMLGFQSSLHPFVNHPILVEMESMPHNEKIYQLKNNKKIQERLIAETPTDDHTAWINSLLSRTFRLGDPLNYEPNINDSVVSVAKRENVDPLKIALKWMLEDNGKALLYHTFENYYDGDLRVTYELLKDDATICGLGDAGAHVGYLCDAGSMTSMLEFWVKGRARGPRLPLEFLIKKQTKDTAETYGLFDRGLIKPGYKADFNLIDLDNISVTVPRVDFDLPAGGKRVQQSARGYVKTFLSGIEVMADGHPTGQLPGKLIRGSTQAP